LAGGAGVAEGVVGLAAVGATAGECDKKQKTAKAYRAFVAVENNLRVIKSVIDSSR
jgi:hypothetical protein